VAKLRKLSGLQAQRAPNFEKDHPRTCFAPLATHQPPLPFEIAPLLWTVWIFPPQKPAFKSGYEISGLAEFPVTAQFFNWL
jgi:hypothetical protein